MFSFPPWLIKVKGDLFLDCYLCTGYRYGEASSVRNSVNSVGEDCSANGSYKAITKL